jgi:hypothetical protein
MVIPQALVDEAPAESATLDVSLNVPAAVGVPVIAPVDGLSVRPVGRLPPAIEKVYAGSPPVATRNEE